MDGEDVRRRCAEIFLKTMPTFDWPHPFLIKKLPQAMGL